MLSLKGEKQQKTTTTLVIFNFSSRDPLSSNYSGSITEIKKEIETIFCSNYAGDSPGQPFIVPILANSNTTGSNAIGYTVSIADIFTSSKAPVP